MFVFVLLGVICAPAGAVRLGAVLTQPQSSKKRATVDNTTLPCNYFTIATAHCFPVRTMPPPKHAAAHTDGKLILNILQNEPKFNKIKPVSYTHLDVYKRQELRRAIIVYSIL